MNIKNIKNIVIPWNVVSGGSVLAVDQYRLNFPITNMGFVPDLMIVRQVIIYTNSTVIDSSIYLIKCEINTGDTYICEFTGQSATTLEVTQRIFPNCLIKILKPIAELDLYIYTIGKTSTGVNPNYGSIIPLGIGGTSMFNAHVVCMSICVDFIELNK